MTPKRLAIVSTHPIQYHSAWFRQLAFEPGLQVEVLYCHQATPAEQANAGFGVEFDWDVSLLDGYSYRFLRNVSQRPTIAGFRGLDTPEIDEILARERFDAVMINGWHYKSAWQTMRACWKTKTPVMVRSDSHLHTQRTGFKRAAKWPLYRWFISKLDACLSVGTWSSDYFLHYGAAHERIFVVPHVIDTDYFTSESRRLQEQRELIRTQWSLGKDDIVFLFAGKFTAIKRPLDFVNAIALASRQRPNIAGLMVGDGPLRFACEALVKSQNLPIKFSGFLNQSRMPEAYVASDGLVLPSTAETWGLVVNEAMVCGRPCFVSNKVGSAPDLVSANETGGTFGVGDIEEIGMMLGEVASDSKRLVKMGGWAKQRVQHYTIDFAAARLVRAVEAIVA
jgi:glycosyltransferase involved in cell wall biosynthesis